MLQESVLDLLYSKRKTVGEFNYDMLMAPNIYSLLSPGDISSLYNITTSGLYAGNTPKKKKAMDEIMARRGFKKFAFGTNRMVYRFLEDQSFVVKIPLHELALSDNLREMENQDLLKPFCSKCFQVDPSGEIGIFERVMPITNKLEYKSVADDVFDLIVNKIIGKFVMEDIGTEYFMNIGIRKNFGVVVIDYPEVFVLDGNKLYCNAPVIPNTKFPVCGGCIDYDDGFNRLICKKCGKIYKGRQVEADIKNNLIAIKGGIQMQQPRVRLVRGNEVLVDTISTPQGVDVIKKPVEQVNHSYGRTQPNVRLIRKNVITNPTSHHITETSSDSTKTEDVNPQEMLAIKGEKGASANDPKGPSFEEFVREEQKLLEMDIPDEKLREFVKVVLASNGLAGQWCRLKASQKNVIIENAKFISAPNVLADDSKPLPVSVEEVRKVEEKHKSHAHSDRLKPSEQVINYTKKSAFIPENGNIDAY